MAKGDRNILKADTEDGYTKIADLLLEALAMAKLNGVQKGICLFLWRRTYGWEQKEDRVSLKEFAQACDTSEAYISRQLKQLIKWKVIMRTSYEPGKVPAYTFNTRITQWDKGCLNMQGLSDCSIQGLYKCSIQGLYKCARVNQGSALEPQGIEDPLYTDLINNNKHDDDNDNDRASACDQIINQSEQSEIVTEPGLSSLLKAFEAEFKRSLSPIEVEQVKQWRSDHSVELVLEALKRAVLRGKYTLKYINSILTEWKKNHVITLQDVAAFDAEFQKKKVKSLEKARDAPKSGQARAPAENAVDKKKKDFIRSLYI